MAKSTRSKVKRSFRAKKRTEGIYAAVEAARLNRLASKLRAVSTAECDDDDDGGGDVRMQEGTQGQGQGQEWEDMPDDEAPAACTPADPDAMDVNSGAASTSTDIAKQMSTHGPRGSRREEWRASKGMTPRPQARGMNRQGGIAARRKAGRSHRRR